MYLTDNGIGDICENNTDGDKLPNDQDPCPENNQIYSTDFRYCLLFNILITKMFLYLFYKILD